VSQNGAIVQVCDELHMCKTVGVGDQLKSIRAGSFARDLKPKALHHWRRRWPGFKDPSRLFAGNSANAIFVGVEMIPNSYWHTEKGRREIVVPTPLRAFTLRFTREQHEAFARLSADIAVRHGWPDGWKASPRVLGHEDLSPISRSTSDGGWDPGALRDDPFWSWDLVRSHWRVMFDPDDMGEV